MTFNMIKRVFVAVVLLGVLWAALGAFFGWRERADSALSMVSLKNIGQAVKQWEIDNGALPPADAWARVAEIYKITPINDPVYARICGGPQKEHPGWGMNNRLNFALGFSEPSEVPRFNSKMLPSDALLILPSFHTVVQPLRNGTIPLTRLSETDDTPTNHQIRIGSIGDFPGRAGLYFNNANGVELLTPDEAKVRLAIRKISESKQAKLAEMLQEKAQSMEWDVQNNSVEVNGGLLRMTQSLTATPPIAIPANRKAVFSCEAKGDTPTSVVVNVAFLDQYNRVINVATDPQTAKLTAHYGGQGGLILDTQLPPSTIGFNPEQGVAENPTKITDMRKTELGWEERISGVPHSYQSGTTVAVLSDFNLTRRFDVGVEWTSLQVTINPTDVPIQSKFLIIEIRHNFNSAVTLRNISLR